MPKLNKTEIYKTNAKNVFFGGYQNYTNPLIWVIHTCLLPVTVTVGASLKTLIDLSTRQELSDDDLETIKVQIATLSTAQFEQFIANIVKYQPQSNESGALIKTLTNIHDRTELTIKEFIEDEKNKNVQTVIHKFGNDIPAIYRGLVTRFNQEPIKETEDKPLMEKVDAFRNEQVFYKRQAQQQAIVDYLEQEINAGKKLQHVIKDEVNNAAMTFKK